MQDFLTSKILFFLKDYEGLAWQKLITNSILFKKLLYYF